MLIYYSLSCYIFVIFFFFFNDTATTETYTLSLHDALPILYSCCSQPSHSRVAVGVRSLHRTDRKSTRLNSSHVKISYAGICLKKKNNMIVAGAVRVIKRAVSLCGVMRLMY